MNTPLVVVPLSMVILTVALISLVGVIWRRRRRHQLTDTVEELELSGRAQLVAVTGMMDALSAAWTVTDARTPRRTG